MNVALIPAAGIGKRMDEDIPKQFLPICGKPVIAATLEQFQRCPAIDAIIVAVGKDYYEAVQKITKDFAITKLIHVVAGGIQRQDSVWSALQSAPTDAEIIVVHDAVRPFVTGKDIQSVINAGKIYGAAILAVRTKDTVKVSDEQEFVLNTLDREYLWNVQTPQAFKRAVLYTALQKATIEHFIGTDEASIVENYGGDVKIVEGSYSNIKITTKEDLIIAEALMQHANAQNTENTR
jgi:2-C-methyl-D-erythritol 4-phosphate cytidylyltransferase